MDEKLNCIKSHLHPLADSVDYEFSNGFHKFKINSNPTHWVYISREYLNDNNLPTLNKILNSCQLLTTLQNAANSYWIYLNNEGLHEVDENFVK